MPPVVPPLHPQSSPAAGGVVVSSTSAKLCLYTYPNFFVNGPAANAVATNPRRSNTL